MLSLRLDFRELAEVVRLAIAARAIGRDVEPGFFDLPCAVCDAFVIQFVVLVAPRLDGTLERVLLCADRIIAGVGLAELLCRAIFHGVVLIPLSCKGRREFSLFLFRCHVVLCEIRELARERRRLAIRRRLVICRKGQLAPDDGFLAFQWCRAARRVDVVVLVGRLPLLDGLAIST